jgi:hypothetical protein
VNLRAVHPHPQPAHSADTATQSSALEALAETLGRDAWVTVLTVRGLAHNPRLHVINRSTPRLASDIYAESGWYWWPHAERIARTATPGQAAAIIAQALGAGTHADGPAAR